VGLGKGLKTLIFVLLGLGLVAGIAFGLLYFGIMPVPGSWRNIPVLGSLGQDKGMSPLEVKNNTLQRVVQSKNSEIKRLREDLKKAEAARQEAQNRQAQLEKELQELRQTGDTAAVEQKIFKQLAGYYSAIKPKNAAAVFEKLDDETVIGILQNMDAESAARVIAAMQPERAATITRKMLRVAEP